MKTMDKMMDMLSIDNRPPLREHQEPEIRNLNFIRPATQQNRPREVRNHDENNQPIRAPFPENFVADEAKELTPMKFFILTLMNPFPISLKNIMKGLSPFPSKILIR